VKGQSNTVIAGSPRNAFRCSVACSVLEVEHCLDEGAQKLTDFRQTPNASTPSAAVRLWGISSMVERETAQIAS
jgi:hypothetical protein